MSEAVWTDAGPDEATMPSVPSVVTAFAGFGVLGLCAALGMDAPIHAAQAVSATLLVDAGALVLTAPGLLVVHQYLGLSAEPSQLVAGLARAFVKGGGIALGLAPTMLLFSATSGLAVGVLVLLLLLVAGGGLHVAWRDLIAAEPDADPKAVLKMRGLMVAWAGLAVAIGTRIAWDLLPGGA